MNALYGISIARHSSRNFIFSTLSGPTFLCRRSFSYDHIVIGGGVVGLAVAAKLAE